MSIADWTLADWIVVAAASWTIAAFVIAPPIGRFLRGRADVTPPIDDDSRWLDAWASGHPAVHNLDVDEVRALLSEPQSKEQIDRRCREILAIEGLSS